MTYINLTQSLALPSANGAATYIDQNWVTLNETTFMGRHFFSRAVQLTCIPVFFTAMALDTIIGVGVGVGAVCTLGRHIPTSCFAINHLNSADYLFAGFYEHFLRAINPKAQFSDEVENTMGFFPNLPIKRLAKLALSYRSSDNFLKQHVVSRLTYTLLAVSCVVTRIADAIICIVPVTLSVLTVGKFQSLNDVAYRTLQPSGILVDLFFCTIKILNPWNPMEMKGVVLHVTDHVADDVI